MKKLLPLLLLCMLFELKSGNAQINLVRNPSFESTVNYDTSSLGLFIETSPPWHRMDSTAFYGPVFFSTFMGYNSQCQLPIPAANWGGVFQYPKTGNNVFIGIELQDSFPNALVRSYAIGELKEKLKPEKTYCVTFFTNLAKTNASGIGINRIGAYLSNSYIDTIHNQNMVYHVLPQVECNGVITDTMNWTTIQGMITPNGDETRITLVIFIITLKLLCKSSTPMV